MYYIWKLIIIQHVFSVKSGDFIQRKNDYSEYPVQPVPRSDNLNVVW